MEPPPLPSALPHFRLSFLPSSFRSLPLPLTPALPSRPMGDTVAGDSLCQLLGSVSLWGLPSEDNSSPTVAPSRRQPCPATDAECHRVAQSVLPMRGCPAQSSGGNWASVPFLPQVSTALQPLISVLHAHHHISVGLCGAHAGHWCRVLGH